jgi:hypothetical protein
MEKEKRKGKQKTNETSSLKDIGQPCFHGIYMPLFCSMNDQGKLPFKGGVHTLLATDGSSLLNIMNFFQSKCFKSL